ncbi:MAG: hypothetical protein F6K35_36050 [Okeania sp. SIO2H7]|nr:hypothetical protein [Okeania sp. SIO2H7]
MVGAIERIEREIAGIKEAIADLAQAFNVTYENYLVALGDAVRKQLILASYHLCTQKEPEAFLRLSLSSRQKMQQEIKLLTKQATEKLQKLLTLETEEMPSTVKILSSILSFKKAKEEEQNINVETQKTGVEIKSINIDPSQLLPDKLNATLPQEEEKKEEEEGEEETPADNKIETPADLANWQNRIENSIPKILKHLSQNTNILLQKAAILPQQLPPQVLEAASQIESNDVPVGGPPNLLNLAIEIEDSASESEEKNAEVTKVTAIHLRLSEIEFADAKLTAWRKEIRELSGRLNKLQREYKKKQRELAVIEAESAWRASWYDE